MCAGNSLFGDTYLTAWFFEYTDAFPSDIYANWRIVVLQPSIGIFMSKKSIFISVGAILLVAFGLATVIYKNYQASQPGSAGAGKSAVFERQGAPVKGAADARVTIVEFFDPACETCANFYPLVNQLIGEEAYEWYQEKEYGRLMIVTATKVGMGKVVELAY